MYNEWLYLTCKWATKGLDGNEFEAWQELTTKLNKSCPHCEEGYICEKCKNSGLNLTETEILMIKYLELSLAARSNTVN